MMSAGYLVQGTAVEKENKVIEILLSSTRPEEVLAGKLLGLGAAGLLQVLVWFGMIIAAAAAFAAALAAYGFELPWLAMGAAIFFFGAGYLFLGSMMLGAGSLGNSQRESQQLGAVWSLLAVIPMMFLGILLQDPHALPAQIMTWIPFTAPVTVLFRLTFDPSGVAWWELLGSFTVLVISTFFALRLGARLFRIGLVLTGVRPGLRELIRQARLRD
jgi:ABC-2 type transport system permease protein